MTQCELLPAFIRYDCKTDTLEPLSPAKSARRIREPEEFGDNWSDQLESDEVLRVARYADNAGVRTKKALSEYFGVYRRRAPLDYLWHTIETTGVQRLRTFIDPHSTLFPVATKAYAFLKRW